MYLLTHNDPLAYRFYQKRGYIPAGTLAEISTVDIPYHRTMTVFFKSQEQTEDISSTNRAALMDRVHNSRIMEEYRYITTYDDDNVVSPDVMERFRMRRLGVPMDDDETTIEQSFLDMVQGKLGTRASGGDEEETSKGKQ